MLLRILTAIVPGTRAQRLQVEDQLARIDATAAAAARRRDQLVSAR